MLSFHHLYFSSDGREYLFPESEDFATMAENVRLGTRLKNNNPGICVQASTNRLLMYTDVFSGYMGQDH